MSTITYITGARYIGIVTIKHLKNINARIHVTFLLFVHILICKIVHIHIITCIRLAQYAMQYAMTMTMDDNDNDKLNEQCIK